jgi:hypothetical protein
MAEQPQRPLKAEGQGAERSSVSVAMPFLQSQLALQAQAKGGREKVLTRAGALSSRMNFRDEHVSKLCLMFA